MDKQCGVCCKQFGIMTRGKECLLCSKFICKEHLVRLLDGSEMCVKCEIEKIREKKQVEICLDFQKIESEIVQFQEEFESLEEEKREKVKDIEEIEQKLIVLDREKNEEIRNLEKLFENAKIKSDDAESEYLLASEKMESIGKELREVRDLVADIEKRNKLIENETMKAREKKQQYGLEIEYLNGKVLKSFPADDLEEVLCAKCKAYVGKEYFPRDSGNLVDQ